MSNMSDWSKVITEIGDESRDKQTKREARMAMAMPGAIRELPEKSSEDLLALYEEFSSGVFWPIENVHRQEFLSHVRAEILSRMDRPAKGG